MLCWMDKKLNFFPIGKDAKASYTLEESGHGKTWFVYGCGWPAWVADPESNPVTDDDCMDLVGKKINFAGDDVGKAVRRMGV